MAPERVIWITGLSGSGKTTVALHLREKMLETGVRPVLLDGDRLRAALPLGADYAESARRGLAAVYGALAREFAEQGHFVVCATVSLFHEVQRWNRKNLPNYFEVWLRVPEAELRKRDRYGLYRIAREGSSQVVGVDIVPEFPLTPDLIINNHGTETPGMAADRIFEALAQAHQA